MIEGIKLWKLKMNLKVMINVYWKNISLEIDKGIYRVEGENGSGKSTLLQLLAGLETLIVV